MPELDRSLVSPAFARDPYPTLRHLREDGPGHWSDSLGGWLLTRFDDVMVTFRDVDHFSNGVGWARPWSTCRTTSVPASARSRRTTARTACCTPTRRCTPASGPWSGTRSRHGRWNGCARASRRSWMTCSTASSDDRAHGRHRRPGHPAAGDGHRRDLRGARRGHPSDSSAGRTTCSRSRARTGRASSGCAGPRCAIVELRAYLGGLIAARRAEPTDDLLSAW